MNLINLIKIMLDYYGNIPGPTPKEACNIITGEMVKHPERESLIYITNKEIEMAIEKLITDKFPTSETIGSVSGWNIFFYKDLKIEGLGKIKGLNEKIKKNRDKMTAGMNALKNKMNDNVLNNINEKMNIQIIMEDS